LLSWLRTTPIAKIIPMDDNILFHKFIALCILFTGGLHIICHYFNFWAIAQDGGSAAGIAGIFQLAFGSWHGITGHAILFAMIGMYTTAIEKCRRGTAKLCGLKLKFTGYNLFWETHKLWHFVVIILLLHGQTFWLYVAYPLALMIIEKLIRNERAKHQMRVTECRSLAGDVMMLQFEPIKHPFRYKAGQCKFSFSLFF